MYRYVGLKDKVEMKHGGGYQRYRYLKLRKSIGVFYQRLLILIVYGFPSESYKLN